MTKDSSPAERAEGGRAVAMTRHRADAVVLAATLPALAVPNRLRRAEKGKRLGFLLHDGAVCRCAWATCPAPSRGSWS